MTTHRRKAAVLVIGAVVSSLFVVWVWREVFLPQDSNSADARRQKAGIVGTITHAPQILSSQAELPIQETEGSEGIPYGFEPWELLSEEVPNGLLPLELLIGELVKSGGASIQIEPRRDVEQDRRTLGELKERIEGIRGADGSLFVTGYFLRGDSTSFQLVNERLVKADVPAERRTLFVGIVSENKGRCLIIVDMRYEFYYDANKGTLEFGNFVHWHPHEE